MTTRLTYNCAHLRSTKESVTVDLGKKKRNWLIHDNIGSVKGGAGSVWGRTGWYLVVLGQSTLVLGQKNLVPIGIKWKLG